MLNVGGGEVLLILLVALIVLGPDKLPDAARQVGKVAREFRRISSGFQREMREAMKDPVAAATQERKLPERAPITPPPPMASQTSDADQQVSDQATSDGNGSASIETRATDGGDTSGDDTDGTPTGADADGGGTPDDPEVGIPSDR